MIGRSRVSRRLLIRIIVATVSATAVLGYSVPTSTAQSIPPKGAAGTFEVASWNIEFFGGAGGPSDDDRQISNVRQTILDSDIDLWALQEIADEADFFDLVSSLGPSFSGLLAPTSKRQGLGLAYIYKNEVVRLRSAREVLTQFAAEFAGRPPYQVEADMTLPDTTVTVTLINLHMKAQSDQESYDKRAAASIRLKNHIDFSTLASQPVIILGDLNDLLVNSITAGRVSPYKNFVDDIGRYGTPTLQMQLDRRSTFCGSSSTCNGSTIDHVIITNEVEPWYVDNSADHYDELLSAISSYVFTTSDHLPVFAVFDIAQGVGVEESPDARVGRGTIHISTYPIPTDDYLTVDLELDRPGAIDLRLLDVMGRVVSARTEWFSSAGVHRMQFVVSHLSSGAYLVVAYGPEGSASRLVVKR